MSVLGIALFQVKILTFKASNKKSSVIPLSGLFLLDFPFHISIIKEMPKEQCDVYHNFLINFKNYSRIKKAHTILSVCVFFGFTNHQSHSNRSFWKINSNFIIFDYYFDRY